MNATLADEVDFERQYVRVFVNREIVWYAVVFTVSVYDHLITLASEVQCVWKQEFSGRTVIFFVNRYFTLLVLLLASVAVLTGKGCSSIEAVILILEASIRFAQGFFAALRVYAICDRNIPISLSVLILSFLPFVMNIVTTARQGRYLEGCSTTLNESPVYYAVVWLTDRVAALISDTVVIVVTWVKTASIRREAVRCKIHVPMATLLLRDGTLHFLLLLGLSIADIVLLFVLFTDNDMILVIFAFRSITLSRFMINLRQVYLEGGGNQASGTLRSSSIRFATSVVGNLGAPLSIGEEAEDSISMDQRERSSNPLAAGLYLGTTDEEDRALLCDKTHPEPPSSAAAFDWQALFEDEAYGQTLLYHVHRGDTLNSIESCDDEAETEEDYTKP